MPKSRWPTQKELNGVSVDFCLIELCLSIFFLSYWFLLLVSDFVFLWGCEFLVLFIF